MSRLSTIETGPDRSTRAALKLPLHSPLVSPGRSLLSSHGGGNDGSWVLSHEVQSRVAQAPVHGLQYLQRRRASPLHEFFFGGGELRLG